MGTHSLVSRHRKPPTQRWGSGSVGESKPQPHCGPNTCTVLCSVRINTVRKRFSMGEQQCMSPVGKGYKVTCTAQLHQFLKISGIGGKKTKENPQKAVICFVCSDAGNVFYTVFLPFFLPNFKNYLEWGNMSFKNLLWNYTDSLFSRHVTFPWESKHFLSMWCILRLAGAETCCFLSIKPVKFLVSGQQSCLSSSPTRSLSWSLSLCNHTACFTKPPRTKQTSRLNTLK